MPVMILDVPEESWNEVVVQSVLFGLDMCPDTHREHQTTVVEITGSEEKLKQSLMRIQKKAQVQLLGMLDNKLVIDCR